MSSLKTLAAAVVIAAAAAIAGFHVKHPPAPRDPNCIVIRKFSVDPNSGQLTLVWEKDQNTKPETQKTELELLMEILSRRYETDPNRTD